MDPEKRKEWTSYQDWLFAIQDVFAKNTLAYDTRFVTDEDPDTRSAGTTREGGRIPGSQPRMSSVRGVIIRARISYDQLSESSMLYPFTKLTRL